MMKAIINGVEVEGTAIEINELLNLHSEPVSKTKMRFPTSKQQEREEEPEDESERAEPEKPVKWVTINKEEVEPRSEVGSKSSDDARRPFKYKEDQRINEFYEEHYTAKGLRTKDLLKLAHELGRTPVAIRVRASAIGAARSAAEKTGRNTYHKGNAHARWIQQDRDLLKQMYEKRARDDGSVSRYDLLEMSDALKRSPGSVQTKVSELRSNQKPKEPSEKPVKPSSSKKQVKARQLASINKEAEEKGVREPILNEYKKGRAKLAKASKKYEPSDRPYLNTIPEYRQDMAFDVFKHLIANGGLVEYPREGRALGFENGSHWRYFVNEVQKRSGEIAGYFGVPDRFVFPMKMEKYHTIGYTEPLGGGSK